MRERRRAAAIGVAALVVYVVLAATSGRMSPLARRPVLDTTQPQPYQWVSPPPELASTNITPKSSGFSLLVRNGHVPADTLPSSDGQVILIVPENVTTLAPGTSTIAVKVTPLDPATLGPPGDGLVVLGNVYRVQATFEPSGAKVRSLAAPLEAILTYPAYVGPPVDRTVVVSTDGHSWKPVDSKESPAYRQIEGPMDHLGYVAVAGPPVATTTSGRSVWVIVGAGLVAVMLLAAGAAFVFRRRRSA